MAVSAGRITEKIIRSLKAPHAGSRILYDEEIPGLGVRITANSVISFVLDYRINERKRRYTIGRYPELNAAAARAEAIQLRGALRTGEDPLAEKEHRREAPTVEDLFNDYMERHAKIYLRPNTIRSNESMARNDILPKIGKIKVADLKRRDVEELHQSLKDSPYQANRVRALLSKMLNLAKHPNQSSANAIRLMRLTGARKREARTATWAEFNLELGVWTKPSHHTKQKRTEHVPLSAPAVQLLVSMNEKSDSPYLFPGEVAGKPTQEIKRVWMALCKQAHLKNVRLHDLRHTYASHLVSSRMSLPIVGRLLGHTQPQTTARYAHLADDPLRQATDRFASIVAAARSRNRGEVVPLHRERNT